MKKTPRVIDYAPIVFIAAAVFIGIYFADRFDNTYAPIKNGILAMTLLAFEYRVYYLSPKLIAAEPTRLLFQYPTGFKYVGFALFIAILNYWAIDHIFTMIYYITSLLDA